MDSSPVQLYIYELSNGLARQMSPLLLGKQIDGIWHTGVVCFGQEFFYGGGGIESCLPGGTVLGKPNEIVHMGNTHIPVEVFMEFLRGLGEEAFRADKYHLFEHNCNKFSNEVSTFLTGRTIPKKIHDLPRDVLDSAFGQMIKPLIDSMRVTPAGGASVTSQSASTPRGTSSTSTTEAPTNPESVFEPRGDLGTESHKQSTSTPAPVIFKPDNITQAVQNIKEKLEILREGTENKLLHDIELCISKNKDIRISDNLVDFIENIFQQTSGTDCLLDVLELLKALSSVQAFTQHCKVQSVLSKLIGDLCSSQQKHIAGIQVLCNAISTKAGHDLLLSNKVSNLTAVITNCLLDGENDIQTAASDLAFNVARYKVSEDVAFECSTAIIEVLTKHQGQQTTYNCLFCLRQFMKCSDEVGGLAQAMGIDIAQHQGHSEQVDQLCHELKSLMS